MAGTQLAIAFAAGWILDLIFGDPERLPHPIVWFGKAISASEHCLNRGKHRRARGAVMALGLITATATLSWALVTLLAPWPWAATAFAAIAVFYCLAGTTLAREVRMVFQAADRSLDDGRRQVARIVGRDTASLSDAEVRTAALETLAENLSDGVIAPMFYYIIAGVPGILTYKMINTLDSMVGYRSDRYRLFGTWAARIDDIANFIPARLTALLMLAAAARPRLAAFVWRFGRMHASPNSGYPEAALAAILNCRFGGTHDYFGQSVYKPYIGTNPRPLTTPDMQRAITINRRAETIMAAIVIALCLLF